MSNVNPCRYLFDAWEKMVRKMDEALKRGDNVETLRAMQKRAETLHQSWVDCLNKHAEEWNHEL